MVLESDDWGAVRAPSAGLHQRFIKDFQPYSNYPYLRFDALERSEDIERLADVLASCSDADGKTAVLTANVVVGNPDFELLIDSSYSQYAWEPFRTTYERYDGNGSTWLAFEAAMAGGHFIPQFHGREHVNVPVWLDLLRAGHQASRKCLEYHSFAVPWQLINGPLRLQASLDYVHEQPLAYQRSFLEEGMAEFQRVFGHGSGTFIPNNFILPQNLMPLCRELGVRALQGIGSVVAPVAERSPGRKPDRRWSGYKYSESMAHLVRNCIFEPFESKVPDTEVDRCLKEMAIAFSWRRPAIISTHRANYIGRLDQAHADGNLKRLELLLSEITRRWPDAVFIDSASLADRMIGPSEAFASA